MKTILTFIAVIFFTTTAFAQSASKEVKVATSTVGVELTIEVSKEVKTETEVARLYMFKNSRVKKALAFKTKSNKSKMA